MREKRDVIKTKQKNVYSWSCESSILSIIRRNKVIIAGLDRVKDDSLPLWSITSLEGIITNCRRNQNN